MLKRFKKVGFLEIRVKKNCGDWKAKPNMLISEKLEPELWYLPKKGVVNYGQEKNNCSLHA